MNRDELRDAVVSAAIRWREEFGQNGSDAVLRDSIDAYLRAEAAASADEVFLWVERTWADVRRWDIVRPPGQPEAAAQVISIGPVTPWHVNHAAGDAAQYRPNEHLAEWSARAVTLLPSGGKGTVITPELGMRPEAPVEIQVSAVELDAILLLGGWECRVEASP